ncbi:MAG TPA: T9SS type A sorting domain-containing protein [bacterium]|nr:T9SS type A sorting domain-containing protein [bacterium]HPN34137.1 T9SS type A sorting domain-containing protein [bacterium]
MVKAKKWVILLVPILALLFVFADLAPAKSNSDGLRSLRKSTVMDYGVIDVNQIYAYFPNDGILCSDPSTGQSGLFYPKGGPSNQSIIYTAGLWVLGKIQNDIRSAVSDYATEFQPGMILENGAPDDPADPKYKVFKFEAETWDDASVAADRAAAIAQGMEDKMYGDQMLYFVMNDYASHAAVFTKPPIGLEVRTTVFGYNRVGALGNVIFIKNTFINKGADDLLEAYCAQFFDPDLGQSNDDAVGCDTTLGIGYVYNMDADDDNYGTAVPAFGCDFFQGPVVPSPGDVANLPGQPPLADHKVLSMTSFSAYINSGPEGMNDPDLASANGAQQAYWYCQGLKGDGSTWIDPTKGNTPSRWLWYGNPVTGTGWLQKDTWPGADMRMSLASGPFTLVRNVPYSVVVGYVVGQGSDYLNSVEIMKSYDKSAQTAYDLNFEIAKPAPYPTLTVGAMDQQIVLTWDTAASTYSAEDRVNLDPDGNPSFYNFQGYKLYQGASEAGPWTLIKQWDKDDGVTKIWDYVYDSVSGENIYSVVENGDDTGLAFSFVIDKDYLKNTGLVNGKAYYFSLTTYSYNEFGSPRVLENAVKVTRVIPQKPVLNTKIVGAVGQALETGRAAGSSDGSIVATVVNPAVVTGHDYKVVFYNDDEGHTLWKVVDVTAGVDRVVGQSHQASAATVATDNEFPVVDGVQVKVAGSPEGLKDEGYVYVPSANRFLTAWNDASGAAPLWHMEGWAGLFGWAENFFGTGLPATGCKNVEIRFAACDDKGVPLDLNDPNVSMAYRYMRGVGATSTPAKPEFEPFIINKAGGYPYQDMRPVCFAAYDMESNPPRRLNVGFNENNTTSGLVNGAWMPGRYDTEGGMNATREFMFIFASDYSTTPQEMYTTNDMLNGVYNTDLMYVGVPSRRGDRLPQAGDKIILSAYHPNSPADVFTFSTAGLGKVAGADIAKARMEEINVFPNPYLGTNEWETDFFAQFVTFNNLPEKCTIRIFSLSGQMIRTIIHDDGTPFQRWNLQNTQNLPVASGMYICMIEVPDIGTKVLKLAVINREARYQHM